MGSNTVTKETMLKEEPNITNKLEALTTCPSNYWTPLIDPHDTLAYVSEEIETIKHSKQGKTVTFSVPNWEESNPDKTKWYR